MREPVRDHAIVSHLFGGQGAFRITELICEPQRDRLTLPASFLVLVSVPHTITSLSARDDPAAFGEFNLTSAVTHAA